MKIGRFLFVLFTVIIILCCIACHNPSSSSPVPAPLPTVYMAGHDEDACYWVDGTKYDLGGTDANAIAVADGVVYVAGTYVDDNNVYRACYWVDGTRYDLNGKKANAIAVADGIIYIAGCYEDNNITKPCYWVNGARYGMEIEANHNSFLISERFKIVTVHGDLA